MAGIVVLKFKVSGDEEQLLRIGELCRKGRNVAAEDWLLRIRGVEETFKQKKPKSESGKMYHAVTEELPELGSDVASSLSKSVAEYLSGKVDWRRGFTEEGRRRKRSDAIASYEDRPPFFTDVSIPVANKYTTVQYGDTCSVFVRNVTRKNGEQLGLSFEVSLKGVPTGMKRHLVKFASGSKMSDSKLIWNRTKKQWYWHIKVDVEQQNALDKDKSLILSPALGDNANERMFFLSIPGMRDWGIGDGRYLLAQTNRLVGLRKEIGWRYKQKMGAGHGRKKIDAAISKRNHQLANIRGEVRRRAISDIINQCKRHCAGTLIYKEPTGPVKTKTWLASVELEFDYTRFANDLKNACSKAGIEFKKKKLKMEEVKNAA